MAGAARLVTQSRRRILIVQPAIAPALAGGALIGLASGLLWLIHGRIAGITGITREAITGPERGWRLAFVLGLLLAGVAARMIAGGGATAGLGDTPLWRLALAGLVVGLGTSLANGCTSGHGICGLARLSPRSLAAVPIFMGSAFLTVLAIKVLA